MTLSTWLIYAGVALVAIASPGPAIALAIGNAVSRGLPAALLSSLGNVVGVGCLSLVATLGLGALLESSAALFTALKVVGACYLIWLGVRQLRGAGGHRGREGDGPEIDAHGSRRPVAGTTVFAEGVLVALSNPKAILFFTALFPQFVDRETAVAPQFALLTVTFMGLSFCSLATYALLAHRARRWLKSDGGATWFRRASGTAFVAMGLAMLSGAARASPVRA